MSGEPESSPLLAELATKLSAVRSRRVELETQLLDAEDRYLDSTFARGNILKGWEGLTDYKLRPATASAAAAANGPAGGAAGTSGGSSGNPSRKPKASERLFSFSSLTSPIPAEDAARDEETPVAGRWAKAYEDAVYPSLERAGSPISSVLVGPSTTTTTTTTTATTTAEVPIVTPATTTRAATPPPSKPPSRTRTPARSASPPTSTPAKTAGTTTGAATTSKRRRVAQDNE